MNADNTCWEIQDCTSHNFFLNFQSMCQRNNQGNLKKQTWWSMSMKESQSWCCSWKSAPTRWQKNVKESWNKGTTTTTGALCFSWRSWGVCAWPAQSTACKSQKHASNQMLQDGDLFLAPICDSDDAFCSTPAVFPRWWGIWTNVLNPQWASCLQANKVKATCLQRQSHGDFCCAHSWICSLVAPLHPFDHKLNCNPLWQPAFMRQCQPAVLQSCCTSSESFLGPIWGHWQHFTMPPQKVWGFTMENWFANFWHPSANLKPELQLAVWQQNSAKHQGGGFTHWLWCMWGVSLGALSLLLMSLSGRTKKEIVGWRDLFVCWNRSVT